MKEGSGKGERDGEYFEGSIGMRQGWRQDASFKCHISQAQTLTHARPRA